MLASPTMIKEASRILNYLPTPREARPHHIWASLGVAAVALLGVVTAFGTVSGNDYASAPQRDILEQLPLATHAPVEALREFYVHEESIRDGDTVSGLFTRLGVSSPA